MDENLKQCSVCKEWKERTQFHKKKAEKDGLYCQCKACVSVYTKAYNDKNREAVRERSRQNREKNPSYFVKYRQEHKDEIAQYRKERYAKNKEAEKAYGREYKKKHRYKISMKQRERRKYTPRYWYAWQSTHKNNVRINTRNRRARIKGNEGYHTVEDIRLLYEQQKGLCYYCTQPVTWENRHDDHKQPVSRGGSNWPDNIAITCPTCNISKGAKTAEEFIEWIKNNGKAI